VRTIPVLFKLLVAYESGATDRREIPGSLNVLPAIGDALSIQLYDNERREHRHYYGEVNNVVHGLRETHAPGATGMDFIENPITTINGTVRYDDGR